MSGYSQSLFHGKTQVRPMLQTMNVSLPVENCFDIVYIMEGFTLIRHTLSVKTPYLGVKY